MKLTYTILNGRVRPATTQPTKAASAITSDTGPGRRPILRLRHNQRHHDGHETAETGVSRA